MQPGDILLVDDDPDLLKLISLRLTSAGYRVRTADSGETALAALAVARPGAVITDLKNKGVGPKKIPTTGQDATLQGMENVLTGYQCGSVYKPIYKEAQTAVALATIVRAGQSPAALINGQTTPPKNVQGNAQPAVLLTPTWVVGSNMNDTVIKDKFIQPGPLCAAVGHSACAAAGITG